MDIQRHHDAALAGLRDFIAGRAASHQRELAHDFTVLRDERAPRHRHLREADIPAIRGRLIRYRATTSPWHWRGLHLAAGAPDSTIHGLMRIMDQILAHEVYHSEFFLDGQLDPAVAELLARDLTDDMVDTLNATTGVTRADIHARFGWEAP